jgi:hypothetical protein
VNPGDAGDALAGYEVAGWGGGISFDAVGLPRFGCAVRPEG